MRDSKEAWIVRTPYDGGVERLHFNIYEERYEAQRVATLMTKIRRVMYPEAKESYVTALAYLPRKNEEPAIGEDPAKILKDPDPADSYEGR